MVVPKTSIAIAHQSLLCQKTSHCPFVWYQIICSALFGCDRQADRQTDRITTPKTVLA